MLTGPHSSAGGFENESFATQIDDRNLRELATKLDCAIQGSCINQQRVVTLLGLFTDCALRVAKNVGRYSGQFTIIVECLRHAVTALEERKDRKDDVHDLTIEAAIAFVCELQQVRRSRYVPKKGIDRRVKETYDRFMQQLLSYEPATLQH